MPRNSTSLILATILLVVQSATSFAAPVVELTDPADQAIAAPLSTSILIRFGSPMDTTTIVPNHVLVTSSLRGTIAHALQWSTSANELTIVPTQSFLVGERVGVTLTSGIRDAGGVPLARGHHFEFSTWTAPRPDGVFVTASEWWPVGAVAVNLTVADLNGDLLPEAIFSNTVPDSITILTPDGQGGFDLFAQLSTGILPRHTLACDIDDDGDVDLVCCASGPSLVQVFRNLGSGVFGSPTSFPTGATPYGAFAGDLDADGDLDVATANFNGHSVSVLRNNGAGTFAPFVDFPAGIGVDSPRWVDGADFDGDGDIDLACCSGYSDDVSIFLNDGNATFAVQSPRRSVGDNPNFMEVRDLDGDAITDIVTVDAQSGTLSFLRGNGNGTFQAAVFSPVGGDLPYGIQVVDVDGDLDLDVIVPVRGLNGWRVMHNAGGGAFSQGPLHLGGTHCHTIGAADWDLDGDVDVVSGFAVSRTMHSYTHALSPTVLGTIPEGNQTGVPLDSPIVFSFNTDLAPETVVPSAFVTAGSQSGPRAGTVLWSDAQQSVTITPGAPFFPGEIVTVTATDALAAAEGLPFEGFSFAFMIQAQGTAGGFAGPSISLPGDDPLHVAACDFDEDGTSDLAVANYLSNDMTILRMGPGGSPTILGSWPTGSGPVDAWCGDVNVDGLSDILVANLVDSSVSILHGDGGGGFATSPPLEVGGAPAAVAAGDFNLDGDVDLVIAQVAPSGAHIFYNDGHGAFPNSVFVPFAGTPHDITTADLDRDGGLDCIVADGTNDLVRTYTYVSGIGLSPTGSFATGATPVSVFPWDVNGDSWIDLVCANFDDGLSILENLGNGSGFAPAEVLSVAQLPHAVWGADFDGDSDLDLVTANSGASSLSLHRNQGNGVFDLAMEMPVGATPYAITCGDWNGDGAVDIASVNRAAASLSILFNQASTGLPVLGHSPDSRFLGAYPNPFRAATSLRFALAQAGPVRLVVFDVHGREVARVLEGVRPSGSHAITWDGRDSEGRPVSGGVYFLKLESDGKSFTDKVLRIR